MRTILLMLPILLFVACGKQNPQPGPGPVPNQTTVRGEHITILVTAKAATLADARLVALAAIQDLEP